MANRTLKQSTAANAMVFVTSATDHVSGLPSLTLTITSSADGGAFGSITPTVTDRGSGWYNLALTTTHTGTLGDLCLHITGSGADPTDVKFLVIAIDLADAVHGGMSALPNAAAAASGGLPTIGVTIPNATAGAAGGLFIAGSNAATTFASITVTTTSTFTGNVSMAAGLTITQSTSNGHGITSTGNGTGAGLLVTGGATGNGLKAVGGSTSGDAILTSATSGHGVTFAGAGTTKHGINATGGTTTSAGISATGGGAGSGLLVTAGATGSGVSIAGGSTSGAGIGVTTTSGDGISVTPTAGNAMTLTANGTSKHGLSVTGGTAGTSDGIHAAAGTGGADVRGNLTGNITGNLSGSAGSVAVVSDKTGYSLSQAFPSNFAAMSITTGGIVGADLQTIKTQTVTCSAAVTINVNVGTTQPVNFTGTSTSALVKTDVIDWSSNAVAATTFNGVPKVDVAYANGVSVQASDGTMASATTTTVTFPTTDSGGNAIPDDGRYAFVAIQITGGTGIGQVVRLTTSTGTARQYNVAPGSMPVTLGTATDTYSILAPWTEIGVVRGTVITGSSASAVIVGGLPTGKSYVGTSSASPQKLYDPVSGEARFISSQSFSSPNYTFTLGSGTGESGPFSATPTTGAIVYIAP